MQDKQALRIGKEHAAGKHDGNPRFDCWSCAAGMSKHKPRFQSMYPEREEHFCPVCRAWHYKGGGHVERRK